MKDLHAIEDEGFIAKVETAITDSGKSEDATVFNSVSGELDPAVFIRLFNQIENSGNTGTQGTHSFDARRYDTDCILMNRADYNKLLLWRADDRGNDFATNMTLNGFNYAQLWGKKLVVTQKGELVPPGTMYAFASKPYIGHAFLLGDVKIWIKKERNIITWSLYETLAYGIGNSYAMAKVTWTN